MHQNASRMIVVQRVVPNYRKAIFRRTYRELGWIVATGDNTETFGLNLVDQDEPWLVRIPMRRSSRRQYAAMVDLNPILKQFEPHAILAEFSLQMSSTWELAWKARRGKGPRLAFWSQGSNVERGFQSPADIISQKLRLALMRSADAQLCYSESGAEYLLRHMPRRQGIFVGTNTLDVAALQSLAVDRSPESSSWANLLLIGRMTEDKRMDVAVNAVGILKQTMPNINLTIVGDGPELNKIRVAAVPLGNSVRFLGAVYDDESLAQIYEQATLTLISGSAGLNVNQSLGFGVPVALFDDEKLVRHHPEHIYVKDGINGYRISSSTAEAMAGRLQVVLSGASPRRLLATSLSRTVDDNLSLDRMFEGMRSLNDFLLQLPPRKS